MKICKSIIITALLFLASPSSAQQIPPPIDLGIQNIPQLTPVWCWAAVAQQIIMAINGPYNTPPQCAMVAIANNVDPRVCCNMPQQCMVTGSLQQIQALIAHFGGRYSSIAAPTDPMVIYNSLASGKAIIMSVQYSPFSGHVVVIRGIQWVPTPLGFQPVLLINDPMSYFTQPIPFPAIATYWRAAIVVH